MHLSLRAHKQHSFDTHKIKLDRATIVQNTSIIRSESDFYRISILEALYIKNFILPSTSKSLHPIEPLNFTIPNTSYPPASITYHGHCHLFISPVILTHRLTVNALIANTKKLHCHLFISPVTPTHFFTISVLIAKKLFLFSTSCPTYCLTRYCTDSCPVCTYFTSTKDDIRMSKLLICYF